MLPGKPSRRTREAPRPGRPEADHSVACPGRGRRRPSSRRMGLAAPDPSASSPSVENQGCQSSWGERGRGAKVTGASRSTRRPRAPPGMEGWGAEGGRGHPRAVGSFTAGNVVTRRKACTPRKVPGGHTGAERRRERFSSSTRSSCETCGGLASGLGVSQGARGRSLRRGRWVCAPRPHAASRSQHLFARTVCLQIEILLSHLKQLKT